MFAALIATRKVGAKTDYFSEKGAKGGGGPGGGRGCGDSLDPISKQKGRQANLWQNLRGIYLLDFVLLNFVGFQRVV